jgi:hypothetical protein
MWLAIGTHFSYGGVYDVRAPERDMILPPYTQNFGGAAVKIFGISSAYFVWIESYAPPLVGR